MDRHAGMHEPACMHAAAAAAAAAWGMRACVVARVVDTVYQLIYSSAQTQACGSWRGESNFRIGIFAKVRNGQIGALGKKKLGCK
jgi:hypothetical protein